MGSGTDAARKNAPEHAEAIDNMKDQLIMVLISRLGGHVKIPVEEMDDTGGKMLNMRIMGGTFEFKMEKMQ